MTSTGPIGQHSSLTNRFWAGIPGAVLLVAWLWCAPVASGKAQPSSRERVAPAVYAELRSSADGTAYVIVLLRPVTVRNASPSQIRNGVRELQDRVLARLAPGEFTVAYQYHNFAALAGRISANGLAKLEADTDVVGVGLDAVGHAHLDDSVPFIKANQAHTMGVTGAGVTVAVLDTGVDATHPDLSDNIATGAWHFLDEGLHTGPGAADNNGHGTNVAGIITSKGQVASVGVAPDADVLAVKVLDAYGDGYVTDWAAGVDYVVDWKDAHPEANLCAINMSLGTGYLYSQCPCDTVSYYTQLLQSAIAAARDAGIVTFASSGNQGSCTSMSSPACLSAVTAVAAVYDQDLGREPDSGTYHDIWSSFDDCFDDYTLSDKVTCFSNRSACNELAAPGALITGPEIGNVTSTYTGTSQAAPHTTGLAALMYQESGYDEDWLSPDRVVVLMKASGWLTFDFPCPQAPRPVRVDALAAVEAVNDGLPCPCRGDMEHDYLSCPPDGDVDSWDVSSIEECVNSGFSACNVPCDVNCDGAVDQGDIDAASCLAAGGIPEKCCAPGDLDYDGDVDLQDFRIFLECIEGPSGGLLTGCQKADLEQDSDVDLTDLSVFQRMFGRR